MSQAAGAVPVTASSRPAQIRRPLALGDPAVHAQGPAPGRRPIGWTPGARRPPSSATPGAQATSAPAPSGCRMLGPSSHAARAIWCSWSPSGCWPWRRTAGGRRSPPSDRSSWPPTPCSEARCCVSAGLPVPALAVGGPPVWMFQFSTVVMAYSLAWCCRRDVAGVRPGHPWLSRRPRVVLAVVYLARWRRWRSGRRRARRSRSTRCAGGSCWTRGPETQRGRLGGGPTEGGSSGQRSCTVAPPRGAPVIGRSSLHRAGGQTADEEPSRRTLEEGNEAEVGMHPSAINFFGSITTTKALLPVDLVQHDRGHADQRR